MNNDYYGRPAFPGPPIYAGNMPTPNQEAAPTNQSQLPPEQTYIENILRLNKGKKVETYVTFPDSTQWSDKIFRGIIEQAGRDHLIMSDPATGNWLLIPMIYVDYIQFDEKINYSKEFLPK